MKRVSTFVIDDVIWLFRDLTRKKPTSIFDNFFLKILKEAHEKYGLKVQLNLFYRTDFFYGDDEFTLAEMTDAYKKEWEQKLEPYVPYLLILSLIILALLIFALACVIMGVSAHSFTGTEANNFYYHLEELA